MGVRVGKRTRIEGEGSGPVGSVASLPGAAAPGGICVDGGQHAEQGRPAAGPRRFPTATDAGHGARPLEAGMQRCRLLGIRRTHRTETPRKDDGRPQKRATPPLSMAPRQTHVPPAPRHRPDTGITTIPDDPPPGTIERQSQSRPDRTIRPGPEPSAFESCPQTIGWFHRQIEKIPDPQVMAIPGSGDGHIRSDR
jgi:hypothetical protein